MPFQLGGGASLSENPIPITEAKWMLYCYMFVAPGYITLETSGKIVHSIYLQGIIKNS